MRSSKRSTKTRKRLQSPQSETVTVRIRAVGMQREKAARQISDTDYWLWKKSNNLDILMPEAVPSRASQLFRDHMWSWQWQNGISTEAAPEQGLGDVPVEQRGEGKCVFLPKCPATNDCLVRKKFSQSAEGWSGHAVDPWEVRCDLWGQWLILLNNCKVVTGVPWKPPVQLPIWSYKNKHRSFRNSDLMWSISKDLPTDLEMLKTRACWQKC